MPTRTLDAVDKGIVRTEKIDRLAGRSAPNYLARPRERRAESLSTIGGTLLSL